MVNSLGDSPQDVIVQYVDWVDGTVLAYGAGDGGSLGEAGQDQQEEGECQYRESISVFPFWIVFLDSLDGAELCNLEIRTKVWDSCRPSPAL
jgi:hypothetical protein